MKQQNRLIGYIFSSILRPTHLLTMKVNPIKIKFLISIIFTQSILSSFAFASAQSGPSLGDGNVHDYIGDDNSAHITSDTKSITPDAESLTPEAMIAKLSLTRFDVKRFVSNVKDSANSLDSQDATEFQSQPCAIIDSINQHFDEITTMAQEASSDVLDMDTTIPFIASYNRIIRSKLEGFDDFVNAFKRAPLSCADTDGNQNKCYTKQEVEAFQSEVDKYLESVSSCLLKDINDIRFICLVPASAH